MKKLFLFLLPFQLFLAGCYHLHIPQTTSEHEVAKTIEKGKYNVRIAAQHNFVAKYSYGLRDDAEIGVRVIDFSSGAYYPYLLSLIGKHAFLNQEKGFSLAVAGELGMFINNVETEGEEEVKNLGRHPLSLTGHLLASYKDRRVEPFASISFRFLQCTSNLAKYNAKGNVLYKQCYIGGDASGSHIWPKTIYANIGLKTWIFPEQLAVSFEFTRIFQEDLTYSSEQKRKIYNTKIDSSVELSYVF